MLRGPQCRSRTGDHHSAVTVAHQQRSAQFLGLDEVGHILDVRLQPDIGRPQMRAIPVPVSVTACTSYPASRSGARTRRQIQAPPQAPRTSTISGVTSRCVDAPIAVKWSPVG